jgi:hypothetical protein
VGDGAEQAALGIAEDFGIGFAGAYRHINVAVLLRLVDGDVSWPAWSSKSLLPVTSWTFTSPKKKCAW